MRFVNISSQFVTCLFMLLEVFHRTKVFNIDEVRFIFFFLLINLIFGIKSKNALPSVGPQNRLLYFFFKDSMYILH